MAQGLQQRENQLRQLVTEMRMMEGSVNTLQQRLQMVVSSVSELRVAKQSLEDLKGIKPGSNLLVPVGGAAFINASLGDFDKVVVGIGADVSIEMAYDDAVKDVNERLDEMEKAQGSIEQQLGQIMAQLEAHQNMAERLSAEIQGAVQGSI
ncbi:prefoldin subunit alpha [Candidatus Bathyarchaeota archaeon]|jgi:prefoldin alpha subunit|nr:prefoldin subunit alpha [Candidatus Bathyarchaeota archaeon]